MPISGGPTPRANAMPSLTTTEQARFDRATISLQAESVRANHIDAITDLAQEVQTASNRARHLLAAMDDASDKASFPHQDRAEQIQMLDRLLVFYHLADAAVREAQGKAEEIESLVIAVKRQAA